LESSGIIEKVLKKGDQAPGFTLSDHNGQAFTSEQLLARGPLIVSFYRGGW
jgi:peroxiredoxin